MRQICLKRIHKISCPSPDEIPGLEFFRENATWDQNVALEFPAEAVDSIAKESIIQQLSDTLPEYCVYDSGGGGNVSVTCVTVYRIFSESDVAEYGAAIANAAQEFRDMATQLINRIAERFQMPLLGLSDWPSFVSKSIGNMDDDWSFYFHGCNCVFENRFSHQVVDVLLDFGDEFGVLDPFTFPRFIQTTPRFSHLSPILSDSGSTARALNLMEHHQLLRKIPSVRSRDSSGLVT